MMGGGGGLDKGKRRCGSEEWVEGGPGGKGGGEKACLSGVLKKKNPSPNEEEGGR